MKIYVVCDLEGVAGVVDHRQQCCYDAQRDWYGKYLDQARRLATLELNAFVEGAIGGGATELVAWEGHGNFPGCLEVELLHPECKLIMGVAERGPVGLDASFSAMAQVGLHAMKSAAGAVLNHGQWRLNGILVGEIGMNSLLAGCHGIPCIFLSGDRAAADEAKGLIPHIETAIVKEGLDVDYASWSPAPAVSLSPVKAREIIRESARRAVKNLGKVSPLKFEPPFALDWFFAKKEEADSFEAAQRNAKRLDDTTVQVCGDNLFELVGS